LARDRTGVDVRVVVLNLLVGDRYDVAALDVDPGAVCRQALKAAGAGKRRPRAPADCGAVAVGGEVEDLEAEVRERLEQLREVLTDTVGGNQLLLADEPIDPAGSPAVNGGIEVLLGQRLEVSLGYV
jgi:hypothetical protein